MLSYIVAVTNCVVVGLLLRWSVAQFPYSGQGQGPKYGDYEAQRHWMEITNSNNLSIQEWYVDIPPLNDLQYWGLDYPPLSAFHSYILGKYLFKRVLPESIELIASHGYESPIHKFWMRFSVLISDILLPSLILFHVLFDKYRKKNSCSLWTILILAVSTPPFILVDYGHFQYNCVSLGLTVLSVVAVLYGQMSATSILFTLAVNHKQMSLYHAVPFFVQMVATTIFQKQDILTAFRTGTMILSTMGLLWLPFGEGWVQVLARIFPLKRGVYEDKVGTFWYVLDRIKPYKGILEDAQIARICMILSLVMLAPSALHHFWVAMEKKTSNETRDKTFLLSLLNISLIFFLFSYHVHEKSIMLPVLPAVLLISWFPLPMTWFITVGSFSLYPLFYEEGSHLALVLVLATFILTCVIGGIFRSNSYQIRFTDHRLDWIMDLSGHIKLIYLASIGGYIILILGHQLVTPPERFPHLFQAAVAVYSFLHYAAFSIYFHFLQFQLEGATTAAATTAKVSRSKKDAVKEKSKKKA